MPKIIIGYRYNGSVEIEITTERVELLNMSIRGEDEFLKCSIIQDEFSEQILNDIKNGNSTKEVDEFGIEE